MKKLTKKPYIIALATFAITGIIYATSAQAANWKTPVEAVQFAAMESGNSTPAADATIGAMPKQKYFQISNDDVAAAVATQMQNQGMGEKIIATMNPLPSPVLYAADHPLKLAIHGLQVDTEAKLWQGQAYILSANKTETVKPVAGRYDAAIRVPVLTRQLRTGDIIEERDLTMKTFPERQLRKDTITSSADLIGQSPRRIISADRPMRTAEITHPTVIKKGDLVEMNYSTPYMHIRTTGEALEDGAKGGLIRVKNSKSDKAISARVTAPGQVEVNAEL